MKAKATVATSANDVEVEVDVLDLVAGDGVLTLASSDCAGRASLSDFVVTEVAFPDGRRVSTRPFRYGSVEEMLLKSEIEGPDAA